MSRLAKYLYGIMLEIGMFFFFVLFCFVLFCFCFLLNISIIIVDINTVRTTLFSEISPVYFDLFFKTFFAKKDVSFCETTDTAHSYIKQIVKFSEIKVSVDA